MQPERNIGEQDVATRKIIAITKKLRTQYINQLQTWKLGTFISEKGVTYIEGERDKLKIEADSYELTEESNYLSRPANEITTRINDLLFLEDYFKSTSNQNVTEAIFSFGQKVNFLVGIAGIGKTTAVEQIVLDWANEKFPKGREDCNPIQPAYPEFDFVFFMRCCDLYKYATETITTAELFQKEFGIDFEEFEQICDPDKVLFILDGLDELPSIEEAFRKDVSGHGLFSVIHDIIAKDSPVLPGRTLLLTTRPHLMKTLDIEILYQREYIHAEEIIGFAAETVDQYIDDFSSRDSGLKDHISRFLYANTSLKLMATVPSILEQICINVAANLDAKAPEKRTKFFIWLLVHLIKNEVQELNNSSVQEVLAKQNTSLLIRILSKMSYNLLPKGNVVFSVADIYQDEDIDEGMQRMLEPFIVKTEATSGNLCKFKYPFLQEFLAAVQCFESGYAINELLESRLFDVVGFVGGLARLNELKDNGLDDMSTMFIKCLQATPAKNGQDLKLPTVNDIAGAIFDAFCNFESSVPSRKRQRCSDLPKKQTSVVIPPGAFLGIFFELFNIGDKTPEIVNLQKELSFSFAPQISESLFQFTHLIQCMIKSQGYNSVSGVTVSVRGEINKQPEYLALAEILGYVKNVFITSNLHDVEFLTIMSNSIVACPENVFLKFLDIEGRFLDEHYGILAPSLPLIESLTVRSIMECQKSASIVADHISKYGENSKLRHLRGYHSASRFGRYPCDEAISGLSEIFPTLESVDLSGNMLNSKNTEEIAKCILQAKDRGTFCRLKKLRLQLCFVDAEFAGDAVFHISKIIPLIEDIDISINSLVGSQMDKIADGILNVACNASVEHSKAEIVEVERSMEKGDESGMSTVCADMVPEVKGQSHERSIAGLTETKDIPKGQSRDFVSEESPKAIGAVVVADVKGQASRGLIGCLTESAETARGQSIEAVVAEGREDTPHGLAAADLDIAVDATHSQVGSSKIKGDVISTNETVVAELKSDFSTGPGADLQETGSECISKTRSESGLMGDDKKASLQDDVFGGGGTAETIRPNINGQRYELKSLNIAGCGLNQFSVKHLCRIIPHLEQLDVSRGRFGTDQATKILECIKGCKKHGKLKKIYVDRWSLRLFDELKEQGVVVKLGALPL